MKKNEETKEALLIIIAAFVVFPIGLFVSGFVVMKIWNWFLPLILGVTSICVVEAIGINLIASMLFKNNKYSNINDLENLIAALIRNLILFPTFYLLIGWIIRSILV